MLRIGTAEAEFTPPAGSLMGCFPHRPEIRARRAEGAHDPLRARAIVMSDGAGAIAFCSCDVTLFQAPDVRRIRAEVALRVPALAGPRTILAATHTHSSYETTYLVGNTPGDPRIAQMDGRIADTIVRAHGALRPAKLAIGRAHAELSHNRRVRGADGRMRMVFDYDPEVTTGPADPDVPVLRFTDPDGAVLSVVYNFAAHALTVGPTSCLYTADFPGVTSELIESVHPEAMALFLNGAAGNQHPRKSMKEGFEATKKVGDALAEKVLAAVESAAPAAEPRLGVATDVISLPHRLDPERRVEVEISVVRLGPVVAAIVPGEPFVEFQLRFKEAVSPEVGLMVGYANGFAGYIPTEAAFDEGGYGVDAYGGDPHEFGRTVLPRGAGEAILDRLSALAEEARP
jgi:hypothetical protein